MDQNCTLSIHEIFLEVKEVSFLLKKNYRKAYFTFNLS